MRLNTLWSALPHLLRAGLLVALPFAAHAAEQTIHQQSSLAKMTAMTWCFLMLFSSGGWAIVHLDTLVEWFAPVAGDLTVEQRRALLGGRLKIVKNYIASISAGVGFFFLASAVPDWVGLKFDLPEMVLLVGVVPAAMGGTITWDKLKGRFGL